MDLNRENQQRNEFRKILLELSKSQKCLQEPGQRVNIYKRLEALYYAEPNVKRFRHFYSDIFSVLTQVHEGPELGDINILGQNLDVIRNGYKPQNKSVDGNTIDVSDAINKLYDHVNLDIARITYSDAADRKISGESSLKKLQAQINELNDNVKVTEKNLSDIEDKLENSQKEYISILGIFAAVVLAFTGGIAFTTSVLNNIAQASIYRMVAVSLIIGLVLINVIFGLFYYLNSMVSRNRKDVKTNKARKNIAPLIISNLIVLALLFATIAAWYFGLAEKRDDRINSLSIPTSEIAYGDEESQIGASSGQILCGVLASGTA